MSTMMYLENASVALPVEGPEWPKIRVLRAAVRKSWSGLSIFSHIGCFSHVVVAATLYPSQTWNHFSKFSFLWSQARKSLASFWFFEYFMMPWPFEK